jgi:hypothetical protein
MPIVHRLLCRLTPCFRCGGTGDDALPGGYTASVCGNCRGTGLRQTPWMTLARLLPEPLVYWCAVRHADETRTRMGVPQ